MPEIRRPSDLECAFYAGLFDARGGLRVNSNHGRFWQACVSFPAAHAPQLNAVYGGKVSAERWELKRYAAVACLLQDILPHVGEKRARIEAVLARFNSRMSESDGAALRTDLKRLRHAAPVLPPSSRERTKFCGVKACKRLAVCRGLCGKHYQQAKHNKTFATGVRRTAHAFSYKRAPTRAELAYIAGYFEGDGNVGRVIVRSRCYPRVSLSQARVEGVLRMQEVYGGSLRFQERQPRPAAIWRLTSREAVIVYLRDVLPFLVEKRRRVGAALAEFSPQREEGRAADHPDEGRSDADLGAGA